MKFCLILSLMLTVVGCLVLAHTSHPTDPPLPKPKPTADLKPQSGSQQTCPAPSEEMLRCIRQWACQHMVRLDMRCLLNLGGNPLIGGLMGNLPPASGTGGGGLLGSLLGIQG